MVNMKISLLLIIIGFSLLSSNGAKAWCSSWCNCEQGCNAVYSRDRCSCHCDCPQQPPQKEEAQESPPAPVTPTNNNNKPPPLWLYKQCEEATGVFYECWRELERAIADEDYDPSTQCCSAVEYMQEYCVHTSFAVIVNAANRLNLNQNCHVQD